MSRYVINLPSGSTTEHAKKKNIVRQSHEWKELREEVRKSQRTDPLTNSRLTKDFNCHHMDMNPDNYSDLNREKFVGLNKLSHTVIHFFAEMKDWRAAVAKLTELLERMEELSDGNIKAR